MRSVLVDAGDKASEESKEGRRTLILFPSSVRGVRAFDIKAPPDGVFVRLSTDRSRLRSVSVDTLILVASDDPWDLEGVAMAKERLRTSKDPKIIEIIRRNHEK